MKDGGRAFPLAGGVHAGGAIKTETGMSLRDYFAAKAMNALLASPHARDMSIMLGDDPVKVATVITKRAYSYADAMLAERDSETPSLPRGYGG